MHSHILSRRRIQAALLALLACVLAAGSTSAAATTTDHYLLRGSQSAAFWELDDPNGCAVTFLQLDSFTSVTVSGQSAAGSYADVIYDKLDFCSGTELSGVGFQDIPTDANAVNAPNPYVTASLSPTTISVPLTDANGVPGPTLMLTVSGAWTATQIVPDRLRRIENAVAPGSHVGSQSFGMVYTATATATVMLGDTNLTPVPCPNGDALIATEMDGVLTVTK